MSNWKKALAVGTVVGAGAYAFAKFVLPKISVLCVHENDDDDDMNGCKCCDFPDEDMVCDCDKCQEKDCCEGYVTIRKVNPDDVPEEVKSFCDAIDSTLNPEVPQPFGEYVPETYPAESADFGENDFDV